LAFSQETVFSNRRILEEDAETASDGKLAGHRAVYCIYGVECSFISKNAYRDDLKMIESVFLRDNIREGSEIKTKDTDTAAKLKSYAPEFEVVHLEKAPEVSAIFTTSEITDEDFELLKRIVGRELGTVDHPLMMSFELF